MTFRPLIPGALALALLAEEEMATLSTGFLQFSVDAPDLGPPGLEPGTKGL